MFHWQLIRRTVVLLKQLEWSSDDLEAGSRMAHWGCPCCYNSKKAGHKENCELHALIQHWENNSEYQREVKTVTKEIGKCLRLIPISVSPAYGNYKRRLAQLSAEWPEIRERWSDDGQHYTED